MSDKFENITELLNKDLIVDSKEIDWGNQNSFIFLTSDKQKLNNMGDIVSKQNCRFCCLKAQFKGIYILNEKYQIIRYPNSIFINHHLVIDTLHCRRKYIERVKDMLFLAGDNINKFVLCDGIYYPDNIKRHFCFHLVDNVFLPLFDFDQENELSYVLYKEAEGSVYINKLHSKSFVIVISNDVKWIFAVYLEIEKLLGRSYSLSRYPFFNLIAFKGEEGYQLIIYPRVVYKPIEFYDTTSDRINIVPGVFDMAGVVMVNSESSYNNLNIDTLNSIYEQISYSFTNLKTLLSPLLKAIIDNKIF